jgi:hypothetical protein
MKMERSLSAILPLEPISLLAPVNGNSLCGLETITPVSALDSPAKLLSTLTKSDDYGGL